MSGRIQVPAALWERLREAFPSLDDRELAALALARGRTLTDESGDPRDPRRELAERAAATILLGQRLAQARDRLEGAARVERAGYERDLELQRDIVPPLKERAKALRSRIRELETRARAAGRDPGSVEPRIDWADTLAVDDFEPPRFERDGDRRKAALEFFRRHG